MFGKREGKNYPTPGNAIVVDDPTLPGETFIAYDRIPLRAKNLYPPLKAMDREWQRHKGARFDMLRDAMTGLTPDEIMLQVIEHMAGRPDVCGTILEKHSDNLRRVAWQLQRGAA